MDLESIRREYSQSGLLESDLADSPFEQFERWYDEADKAGFSLDVSAMTVATVSASGQPSQRMVLLKRSDEKGFVFYTNLESRKARDIKHNSKVSLHFPWHPMERQIIVYGEAEQLGDDEAARYFHSRPRASQVAAWASRQSQTVPSREALEETFETLSQKYRKGDIPRPAFWGGYRVVPHQIEFWQGRRSRLHDRLVYRRQGEKSWTVERLQP